MPDRRPGVPFELSRSPVYSGSVSGPPAIIVATSLRCFAAVRHRLRLTGNNHERAMSPSGGRSAWRGTPQLDPSAQHVGNVLRRPRSGFACGPGECLRAFRWGSQPAVSAVLITGRWFEGGVVAGEFPLTCRMVRCSRFPFRPRWIMVRPPGGPRRHQPSVLVHGPVCRASDLPASGCEEWLTADGL